MALDPLPAPSCVCTISRLAASVWLFGWERGEPGSARVHITARDLLCVVLSATTGTPPGEWRFAQGAFGRPHVVAPAGERVSFSLSYGHGAVAVAVSRRHLIGVDIEPLAPVRLADIPWSELSPREQARLHEAPDDARFECFARMWTLKEAFAKCTGRGVFADFSTVETTLEPPGILGADVSIHQEEVLIGDRRHALAVCARTAGGHVRRALVSDRLFIQPIE